MTFGKQALTQDLVDIFDMADDGRPGTIAPVRALRYRHALLKRMQ